MSEKNQNEKVLKGFWGKAAMKHHSILFRQFQQNQPRQLTKLEVVIFRWCFRSKIVFTCFISVFFCHFSWCRATLVACTINIWWSSYDDCHEWCLYHKFVLDLASFVDYDYKHDATIWSVISSTIHLSFSVTSLSDDSRVVIYDCNMFIIQATVFEPKARNKSHWHSKLWHSEK